MIILPAIDLIDGKCVRLLKGDFGRKTVYGDNPLEIARGFEAAGAKFLHVVDLDGAKNPSARQSELIKKIAQSVKMSVQTGGGIRDEAQIKDYLDNGVDRVIVGSLAAENPPLAARWIKEFGVKRIVLSLDVFWDGDWFLALRGWEKKSKIKLADLLNFYGGIKDLQILSTDIGKDGTLSGPSVRLYQDIKKLKPDCFLQASGGVGGIDDLLALKNAACDGAIIGKALYENKINLKEALKL